MHMHEMLRAFLHPKGWSFDGKVWRKDLVYFGETVCVCPGEPSKWEQVVEAYFKKRAYTSELGIDWWTRPVARLHNGVWRGMRFKLDPWLFERCIYKHKDI